MPFDSDVFISYAHLDNQPLAAGMVGWVSEFHEALGKRLGEVLGKAPRIWRDPKLQGNDVFAREIEERFERAAVLVSVITPRYLESEWCRRELSEFWEAARHTGGPVVGNKARVFKVVKTPVERTRMPPPLEPLLGYEFYRLQPGTGRPLEFNRVYGPDAERDFWVRLNDLAYDLADLLKRLEQPGASPAADQPTAYLATATADLQPQHDALRRELLRHGYGVRPDRELPLRSPDLEPAVAEGLEASRVSIHLIGAAFGVVPEGGVDSLPAVQARLAAERARLGGLVRLVWIAPGAPSDDPRHRAFLAALRDDPAPGPGSDLLETPFEDLMALAVARLTAAERPASPARAAAPRPLPRVYLVCDGRDLDAVGPLRRYLFDRELEVTLPAFEGDETALREDHEDAASRLRRGPDPLRRRERAVAPPEAGRPAEDRRSRTGHAAARVGHPRGRAADASQGAPHDAGRARDPDGRGRPGERARALLRKAARRYRRRMMSDPPPANPFPGLRPFEADEDHLFFGRERETDELLRRLRTTRLLAVVGHFGQRQVVARALRPHPVAARRLHGRRGDRAGGSPSLRPGEDPIGRLAAALDDSGVLGHRATRPPTRRAPGSRRRCRAAASAWSTPSARRGCPKGDQRAGRRRPVRGAVPLPPQPPARAAGDDAAAFVKLLLEAARRERRPRSTSSSRCARTSSATASRSPACPRRSTTASTWFRA